MRIAAICPTFRRPKLIPGIIEMFQRQTHSEKVLLILDDGGSFNDEIRQPIRTESKWCGWGIVTADERFETVWHKFNELIDLAIAARADAIALMEDDDIYLPGYLAAHAAALEQSPWSASDRVWFREPGKPPRIKKATRRFHGGWAYRLDAIKAVGGYPTEAWGSDTTLGSLLWQRFGPAADPWPDRAPQYCYRWHTSGYANAHGFGENMHEVMQQTHPADRHVGPIVPALDDLQHLHLLEVERAAESV